MSKLLILGPLCFVLFGAYTFTQMSKIVPEPYMDEYFHLDQTLHYLKNDFAYWNSKLTTPPGTYLLDYPILKIAQNIAGDSQHTVLIAARFCNTYRKLNNNQQKAYHFIKHVFVSFQQEEVLFHSFFAYFPLRLIFSGLTLFLLRIIFTGISCTKKRTQLMYFTSFLPTVYFFSHLFYTDAASLAFSLAVYLFTQNNRHFLAAIAGAISVCIRQTNIIWMIYSCLIAFIDANKHALEEKNFIQSLSSLCRILMNNCLRVIAQFQMQIAVVIIFLGLVIFNGSIVLGDKQNHESTFHPAQLLYLSLFCFLNLPLSPLRYVQNTLSTISRQKIAFMVFLIISLAIIHKFTLVHRFMLADNRHYVFYIWKNFFGKYAIFKYLMAPVYSFAGVFILNLFQDKRNGGLRFMKLTALFACSCLALIPAGLVEFRYFTNSIVFLIILIAQVEDQNQQESQNNQNKQQQQQINKLAKESKSQKIQKQQKSSQNQETSQEVFSSLLLNISGQILMNIVLVYVFLFKPFKSGTEGGQEWSRFMF